MATADIISLFRLLDTMPTLGTFVDTSCSQLKIASSKPPLSQSEIEATTNEKHSISQKSFGEELNFTVEVNLLDSKAAFNLLVGGLNASDEFHGLWKSMSNCDPSNHPHPMGDLDVSPLEKKKDDEGKKDAGPDPQAAIKSPLAKKVKTGTA